MQRALLILGCIYGFVQASQTPETPDDTCQADADGQPVGDYTADTQKAEDASAAEKIKRDNPTVKVGETGRVGHLLFTANDLQTYEFSDSDLLGAGAWAKVFKARQIGNSSNVIAVKYTIYYSPIMGGYEKDALRVTQQFKGEQDNMVGMTFHHGNTLAKALKSGNMTKTEKDILCAVSEFRVQEFHRRGFVHRDLKPENVMVTDDLKDILLIDFSLAEPIITVHKRLGEDATLALMNTDVMRPCHEIRRFEGLAYDRAPHVVFQGRERRPTKEVSEEILATLKRLALERGENPDEKMDGGAGF